MAKIQNEACEREREGRETYNCCIAVAKANAGKKFFTFFFFWFLVSRREAKWGIPRTAFNGIIKELWND